MPDLQNGEIAYILKGFPRLSETFIASEIYRLEQLGVKLHLFVLKPSDEPQQHDVVGKIEATPFYLPKTSSLTDASLIGWLKTHYGDFAGGVRGVAQRSPGRLLLAFTAAARQAFRARRSLFSIRKTNIKEFLQAAVIAAEILKNPQIKHLHAHFAHGAATVAWLVSQMTGLPFSFTAHAKDIYLESLNPAGLLKRKMDAAEFVVTCTKANKSYLEEISTTPVHCLYHGLSTDFTELLASEPDIAAKRNGHLRPLAVGRLVEKKGFDVFVEACGILKKRGVEFEATIVGEKGEHSELIERKILENQLTDSVRLAGPMAQTELFEEYRRATMFCLPCRILDNGDRDGIPNVMMEAMSCGLPVVTSNISGIPEIIRTGENGIMVEPENAVGLADAMEKLHSDKKFAGCLSAAATETVKKAFDGETTAASLAQLFHEVIGRNGR